MHRDTLPRLGAYAVHALTAYGAVLALLTLDAIRREAFVPALWLMGAAILVDGCDGLLARRLRVATVAPHIDGRLLDNIVDYANYALVPAFFLLRSDVLPLTARIPITTLVVLVSAYQFTQIEAKTKDHFFKGFPCYWNIVALYLFVLPLSPGWCMGIMLGLCVLVFIPIKYVYPTRLEYFSRFRWVLWSMRVATGVWALSTAGLLLQYPDGHPVLQAFSLGFVVFYFAASLYRTLVPLGGVDVAAG